MNNTIKVGFCIAYDWYLLRYALPLVYERADQICLSLDKDRISWTGKKFKLDESAFQLFVREVDHYKKIQIQEEDFHLPALTAGQNEVRQRNRMAEYLGKGGWHIQLDCDEYFSNFSEFVSYLENLPERDRHRTSICCPLLTLFRKTENGYLYVLPASVDNVEYIQIATQEPHYEFGRRNGDFNIQTNFGIIHQSWARSDEEIKLKLSSWGHRQDFDGEKYFEMWKSVDQNNYATLQNFHPIQPNVWQALSFASAKDISGFIQNYDWRSFPSSTAQLRQKNSRILAKFWKIISLIAR
jgi:hypothetical protein